MSRDGREALSVSIWDLSLGLPGIVGVGVECGGGEGATRPP